MPTSEALKAYLDDLVARFEQPTFIPDDPIAIAHGFDDPLAWQRAWRDAAKDRAWAAVVTRQALDACP